MTWITRGGLGTPRILHSLRLQLEAKALGPTCTLSAEFSRLVSRTQEPFSVKVH